jgi:thiamine-monophosphate kinase
VIVSGEHGNSAKGLEILQSNLDLTEIKSEKFINAHLMPVAQRDFSTQIATNINCDYAMMDTSDGLADALMQIAKASNVTLCVDTSRIPHDLDVELDKVLYGGEDYQLIAVVPEDILKKISNYTIIGEAIKGIGGIKIDEEFYSDIDNLIFNHFEEKNEQKS